MIICRHTPEGGFIAGDTETRITAYAYPSSTNATKAALGARAADRIARAMLAKELPRSAYPAAHSYDERNWQVLGHSPAGR